MTDFKSQHAALVSATKLHEISDSHSGAYEDKYILGCCAV
jgi:hypothetical protein